MQNLLQKSEEGLQLLLNKRTQNFIIRQRKMRMAIISQSRRIFQNFSQDKSLHNHNTQMQITKNYTTKQQIQQKQVSTDVLTTQIKQLNLNHLKKKKRKNTKKYSYKKRFQVPCWLISIPQNFKQYLLILRPEGIKIMIFINNNKTQIRDKNGFLIFEFHTNYNGKANHTILQGIFSQKNNTFYVIDLIKWKNTYFTGDQAVFRYNWLHANLPQIYPLEQTIQGKSYKIELLSIYENNRQNIQNLYKNNFSYEKQAFIFVHPESRYLHQHNQSVLQWKDQNISKYYLKDQNEQIQNEIKGTGILKKDGKLYTLDNVAIKKFLWNQIQVKPYHTFIRFGFTKIQIQQIQGANNIINQESQSQSDHENNLKIKLENFRIINISSYQKGVPDTLSKLIFQYQSRYRPITINHLLNSYI